MTYRWKIELILFDLQFAEHVTRYTTYAVLFTHPITYLTLAIQETGTAMPWSHSLMWYSCVNPAYQARSMAWLPSNIFLWVRGSVLTRESELIQTKSTQTWTPRTCGRYENKKKFLCEHYWPIKSWSIWIFTDPLSEVFPEWVDKGYLSTLSVNASFVKSFIYRVYFLVLRISANSFLQKRINH